MSFAAETRSITDHITILAKQIGVENPLQLSLHDQLSQPSEYEILPYDPKSHDRVGIKQQIVESSVNDGRDSEDVYMWLDAARLCQLTAEQGIDLRQAYNDPKVDVQVVKLVAVLNRSLPASVFDSRVFRRRFAQPMYRPWLYLIAYFTDVWVCQQWQRGPKLFLISALVAGPIVPEWFIRDQNPLPVVVREQESGVPILTKETACVYLLTPRNSVGELLLTWMYLTHCSADKTLKHVLFPGVDGSNPPFGVDVPMAPAEYVGMTELSGTGSARQVAVVSREFNEQRFFPTYRLQEVMADHARPGFTEVKDSKDSKDSKGSQGKSRFDFDHRGRPVVSVAPGPHIADHSNSTSPPAALTTVPQSVVWGRSR